MTSSKPAPQIRKVAGLVLIVIALMVAIAGLIGIGNGFGAVEFVAFMGLAILLAVTGHRLRSSRPQSVS